ncbi:MAG: hypothetical protein C5B49_04255 [Bdellovibrio sp.]|nr:MAG: hypothetical protein C5B49_04255 [Bdellovibrio sp.]
MSKDERESQLNDLKKLGYSKSDEEDIADLVSTAVDQQNGNPACFMVRTSKPEDYADVSLQNSNCRKNQNCHSGPLFRLLSIQFHKRGSITQECERALKAKGEAVQFKNCLH